MYSNRLNYSDYETTPVEFIKIKKVMKMKL